MKNPCLSHPNGWFELHNEIAGLPDLFLLIFDRHFSILIVEIHKKKILDCHRKKKMCISFLEQWSNVSSLIDFLVKVQLYVQEICMRRPRH